MQGAADSPVSSPVSARARIAPLLAVDMIPTPWSTTGVSGAVTCAPKPCSFTASSGSPPFSGAPVSTPSRSGACLMATAVMLAAGRSSSSAVSWTATGHTVLVRPTSGAALTAVVAFWLGSSDPTAITAAADPTTTAIVAIRRFGTFRVLAVRFGVPQSSRPSELSSAPSSEGSPDRDRPPRDLVDPPDRRWDPARPAPTPSSRSPSSR